MNGLSVRVPARSFGTSFTNTVASRTVSASPAPIEA